MSTFIQDLRFGLRLLAKAPAFTALAVLTLALGVTATSTVLSWMTATMFDPVPGVTKTSDIVSVVRGEYTTSPLPPFSHPDFLDLRQDRASLGDMLAYHDGTIFFTGLRVPERGYGALVSANYFDFLGVTPILGRGFLPSEDAVPGGAPVAVISADLWQARFDSTPRIVGRTLEVNRRIYAIIGVAPRRFSGCKTGLRVDVWIPLSMDGAVFGGKGRLGQRSTAWLNVLGRLRPGVDRRAAAASLNVRMQALVRQYPADHEGDNTLTVDPLWRSPFGANGYLAASLPILLAIGAVVLLLACANVANLLLVRVVTRRREIAIRVSIGASRWRLVRQALTESAVVGIAGGIVAAVLTSWTAESLAAFIPPTAIPIAINGRLDVRVLLVTLAVSILTSVGCGVLPALRGAALPAATALKEEAGSVSVGLHKGRVLASLVVAQVALSAVLLVCAGLLVQSLRNAERTDPGFDPQRVALASINPGAAGLSRVESHEFQSKLTHALAALPGAVSVALADWVPMTFSRQTETLEPEGYVPRLHEALESRVAYIGPGYLQTMRTALLSGREFDAHDADGVRRVCLVDRAFAERYWPGEPALGRRVRASGEWHVVVGVAHKSKHQRFSEGDEPLVYLPLLQSNRGGLTIHVRTAGDPRQLLPALEKAVHAIDPKVPVYHVTTLAQSIRLGTMFERIAGVFVGTFGLVALGLAAVGMYGVLAYSTRQRTREIGIRLALGARPVQVFALVLRQAGVLVALGLGGGLLAAGATTRFVRTLLVGVGETDLMTFVAVGAVLTMVALVACAVPAWRAAHVEPLQALRHE